MLYNCRRRAHKRLQFSHIHLSKADNFMYQHIKVPSNGEKITVKKDFSLSVPSNPIIPYIEGDEPVWISRP